MTRPLVPKDPLKQEFAQRLARLMTKKGWRQSELARRADMPRDSVSTYVRGRTLPTPQNLQKLVVALGVTPEDLLPNHNQAVMDDDEAAMRFEMTVSDEAPNKAWLRVNQLVNLKTAIKVADLLQNDEVATA